MVGLVGTRVRTHPDLTRADGSWSTIRGSFAWRRSHILTPTFRLGSDRHSMARALALTGGRHLIPTRGSTSAPPTKWFYNKWGTMLVPTSVSVEFSFIHFLGTALENSTPAPKESFGPEPARLRPPESRPPSLKTIGPIPRDQFGGMGPIEPIDRRSPPIS